jgi:hypothetical protein
VCSLRGTFCRHSVFMCFVWIWEQTAIISLYSINWLFFITETENVYCAVRAETFNIIKINFHLRSPSSIPANPFLIRGIQTCTASFFVRLVLFIITPMLHTLFSPVSIIPPLLHSLFAPVSIIPPMLRTLWLLWMWWWTFGFHKMREFCWVFEVLLSSEEGLYFVELVS